RGAVIRIAGFDDPMTVRAAQKVKKGLDAGKFHVTLATKDGETEVVALDPEECVPVVQDQPGAGATSRAAATQNAKAGKKTSKGKATSETTLAAAAEIAAPAATEPAARTEPDAVVAPTAGPAAMTPKQPGRQQQADGAKKRSALDAALQVLT